jgi:hypothetical protein
MDGSLWLQIYRNRLRFAIARAEDNLMCCNSVQVAANRSKKRQLIYSEPCPLVSKTPCATLSSEVFVIISGDT